LIWLFCLFEFVFYAAEAYSPLDPVLQQRADREPTKRSKAPRHFDVIRE